MKKLSSRSAYCKQGNIRQNPFNHFIVGVNYMPSEHGCQLWSDWINGDKYEQEDYVKERIHRDFKQIKNLGLNTVRTFLFWKDFQPEPNSVSERAFHKFKEMVELAQDCDLKLIPTFFTGHMSGENFDVPWREGRDIYDDAFMLKSQVELVRRFAEEYGDNKTIISWDLANEQDTFMEPKNAYSGWLWTHLLYRELKRGDHEHPTPVTVGTHISSLESDKMRLDMVEADYLCTHPYPMYTPMIIDPLDTIRSTLLPAFTSKLTQCLGCRRVMLQEFGTSTEMTSQELSARFYQSVLYSSLINETIGAIAWCFADYVIKERKPYVTSTHEFEFGIVDKHGKIKQQGEALREFANNTRDIHYINLETKKAQAAIIVPDLYYGSSDIFLPDHSTPVYVRSLFSAFILAKQANLDIDFIKPDDPFNPSEYKLLIIPTVPIKGYLDTQHWEKICRYVKRGGNLYFSYNGAAFPALDDLFGFEIKTQQALAKMENIHLEGHLEGQNRRLEYRATQSKKLCVKCDEDLVLARDQRGDAGFICHTDGKGAGTTFFVTYPIEYYLSFMPKGAQSDSYVLYKIAAKSIQRPIEYDSKLVESRLFRDKAGQKYLLFVNHDSNPADFEFNLTGDTDARFHQFAPEDPKKQYLDGSKLLIPSNSYVILRVQ